MKRTLSLAMGAALVAPLLLFTVVVAQESESQPDDQMMNITTSSNGSSNEENQREIQAAARDKAALRARLDKRRSAVRARLSGTEQNNIKSKCGASQGNISSLRGRIKGIETSRTQVYQNLVERLTKASGLLSANGADVTELNAQIAELETKIAAFQSGLAEYKEAVTDIAAMDCASDPANFKASLEAARTSRTSLKTKSVEIKTYLRETIRPTLTELRSQTDQGDGTEEAN
jgi:hypothetical protein